MLNHNTNTKTETADRLADLMSKRNDLIRAVEMLHGIRTQGNNANHAEEIASERLTAIINELCETLAQIAVYKTLRHLADSVTSFGMTEQTETNGHRQTITTSGTDYCEKLYHSFAHDMHIYRTNDTADIYTDSMDLFTTAYMTIYAYLRTPAPLTLDDIVLTIPKANGEEKNYTIYQTACKTIREYIHTWSTSAEYKKLHYIIGFTDDGRQITTSKRPADDLADITDRDRVNLYKRYGLTARECAVLDMTINGDSAEEIADMLHITAVTVWQTLARAKAKFTTASAYAEYITAKNAEKRAKAKAEKETADRIYLEIYEKAKARTAHALNEWKKAFNPKNPYLK